MAMAKAILLIAAVAMATWGGARGQSLTCVSSLTSCASYLNSTATPPDTCCSPLRTAVKDQLACLCSLLSDKSLLQIYNVTSEEALRVATNCGVTQLNLCSAPASQPSPAVTPSPPGSPGKSAASRAKWIGMSGLMSLFLVLCSIMTA